MTTLTLTIDDEIVEANRKLAAAQGKSIEQLIAEYLASNASQDASGSWAHDFLKIASQIRLECEPYQWNRADAYDE